MTVKTIKMLKVHEGFRSRPYHCTAGKLTIGYGLNLEAGITEDEATYLLKNRVNKLQTELANLSFWSDLSGVRRAVLIDMAYNLGINGLFKFRKMMAALANRDFDKAAAEMQDSRWYHQVGVRSIELHAMMLTNQWPEVYDDASPFT